MGDDPTFFGIPVTVDPDMPPGVIETRSGGGRLRVLIGDGEVRVMAEMMRRRAAADPAFAEDIKSILESKDYFTHPRKATRPLRCECCGTLVTMVPEVPVYGHENPRPAIWEPGRWRKHTLRRCNAMRELGLRRETRDG